MHPFINDFLHIFICISPKSFLVFSLILQLLTFNSFEDIDSLERIDANRSRKLGQNDANRGRKSLKWCKFRLEITENRAEMMQIGPNFASMSA